MQIDNKDGGQEAEAVLWIAAHKSDPTLFWMAEPNELENMYWSAAFPVYRRPQPASTALVERLTKALTGLIEAVDAAPSYFAAIPSWIREKLAPAVHEARSALSASQSTSREEE